MKSIANTRFRYVGTGKGWGNSQGYGLTLAQAQAIKVETNALQPLTSLGGWVLQDWDSSRRDFSFSKVDRASDNQEKEM